ncbi:MAG: sulfurtransferase TusA family protein [Planctomycetes bacterium]|nr:sulfurtransferase TusA family protein [Planctomycetota bacterium]
MNYAPQPDATIDTSGLLCPLPIVECAKRLRTMAVGEVLEVISTDSGVLADLPAWCRSHGETLLGIETVGKKFVGYVRREV